MKAHGLAALVLFPAVAMAGLSSDAAQEAPGVEEAAAELSVGQVLTEITYVVHSRLLPGYSAQEGQPSQRVLDGAETLERLHGSLMEEPEGAFLRQLFEGDGPKAVLIEQVSAAEREGAWDLLYVPFPDASGSDVEYPDRFQGRAGGWFEVAPAEGTTCYWGEWGSHGGDCFCHALHCCGDGCGHVEHSFCGTCSESSSPLGVLEETFGPDPRWVNPMPFAEVEPGAALERVAAE